MLPQLLEEWVDSYAERLRRIAYTYVRDWGMAEDCVQNAFIKAYHATNPYEKSRGHVFAWLARIVINECKMVRRRSWREILMEWLPDRMVKSSEENFLSRDSQQTVHEAILQLPVIHREPIVLFYFEELSVDEISEILGVPTGTIKSRLSRGRERLKHFIREDDDGQSVTKCKATV
ncbi:RNA polymerase sigma factor [Brevibacillus ginsengisoli]|uniref:RNA polymerase sigma factor n=1 Tax=Brevibacillus ginsengisoli TaxID=363854 RepID=UPI003CED25EA